MFRLARFGLAGTSTTARLGKVSNRVLAPRLCHRSISAASSTNAAAVIQRIQTNVGGEEPSLHALLSSLGLLGAASSLYMYLSQKQISDAGHVTRCEANAAAEQSFQLFVALDAKEEMEKVRLAQIIHDLHALAREERGLRRYVTVMKRTATKAFRSKRRQSRNILNRHETRIHQIGDDLISLDDVDLCKLSTRGARDIIESITAGSKLSVPSLQGVVESATELLQKEPNLIDLSRTNKTITFVGDLHGSMNSLTHILKKIDLRDRNRIIVFAGDFVDRGVKSLEVLVTLLVLKLAYPEQVYLLRGNHEDTMVASVYGFQDQIRKIYGDDDTDVIWDCVGDLFASLPLALRTKTAFAVHGGLPNASFDLKDLQKLPRKARFALKTTVKPESAEDRALTGLLWSDPTPHDVGIAENPRGLGVLFGPGVAQEFLQRNNLQYLIRGHECVASGIRDQHCGEDKSVITVFSAAAYPNNIGENKGAFLHLLPDGSYSHESYSLQDTAESTEKVKNETTENALEKVRAMIGCSRSKLEKAFSKVQRGDSRPTVTVEQWVQVMSSSIDFAGMPWTALQPTLAPTSFWSGMIDVDEFLKSHSLRVHDSEHMDNNEAETLAENHEMLLTVFMFLDVNGDGTLSLKEWRTGLNLLNKRLPKERQLKNPEELFKALDKNADGEISFEEFASGFGMA
mmetsp:Transcript_25562/g.52031  ORF Transcript_25562/g.52031 Transcript_25562/m.52031 type:complete len:685 (+) Transcript_25562:298-2352(+)